MSILSLSILALPFVLVALAIKLNDGGQIFFRQERIGMDGKSFRVWKFRTMVVRAESQGLGVTVQRGDKRITRAGCDCRRVA